MHILVLYNFRLKGSHADHSQKGWRDFEEACAFARQLRLKSHKDWYAWRKGSNNRPADVSVIFTTIPPNSIEARESAYLRHHATTFKRFLAILTKSTRNSGKVTAIGLGKMANRRLDVRRSRQCCHHLQGKPEMFLLKVTIPAPSLLVTLYLWKQTKTCVMFQPRRWWRR